MIVRVAKLNATSGIWKAGMPLIGQIKQFKIGDAWITGEPLMIMLAIIAAAMAIIYFLPKFSKVVPEILVAVQKHRVWHEANKFTKFEQAKSNLNKSREHYCGK
jgi:hypothetical protein